MNTIAIILLLAICALSGAPSAQPDAGAVAAPTVDVEMLWTEVRDGKVDLYTLITNPNDFDVYVARSSGGSVACNLVETVFEGFVCCRPEDFTLLPAREKRISEFWRGYKLARGSNTFRVELSSGIDPSSDLPSNYITPGTRKFEFVITNPTGPSRNRSKGLAHAGRNTKHPEPRVDAEMVWTDVRDGKVDLFLLVTNPNDFDVYASTCRSSRTEWIGAETEIDTHGDGPAVCSDPADFTLVPARSKLVKRRWFNDTLDPGPNQFHIDMAGSRDPRLPWNYVLIAPRSFHFVVTNPDSLSR